MLVVCYPFQMSLTGQYNSSHMFQEDQEAYMTRLF